MSNRDANFASRDGRGRVSGEGLDATVLIGVQALSNPLRILGNRVFMGDEWSRVGGQRSDQSDIGSDI